MEYKTEKKGSNTILYVQGDIKTEVSAEFQDRLLQEIDQCDILLVDLSDVEYICSAGLRAFLACQRKVDETDGKELQILNVCDEVMDVFSDTGFDNVLTIR